MSARKSADNESVQSDAREALRQRLLDQRLWWGDIYIGTREQVIAAGFLSEGMFPGDPGIGAHGATFKDGVRVLRGQKRDGPNKVRVTWKSKRTKTFEIWVELGPEELEAKRRREEKTPTDTNGKADSATFARAFWRQNNERVARDEVARDAEESDSADEQIDDDADWPPHVRHNPAIQVGDGSRWHYLAPGNVLVLEGILDADECPGDPACEYKWRTRGWTDGIAWQATRVGKLVAVTILHKPNLLRCVPLEFKVR
jgi:hypothetical protein